LFDITPPSPIRPLTHSPQSRPDDPGDERLRAAASALEANFLAIMLGAAGFGAARDAFGGGVGEEQFSSFLVEAHADALMRRGGIGLAESLFESLKERSNGLE